MKKNLYILMLLCFAQVLQAQDNSEYRIIRSNLGSSGSSHNVTTTMGTYKISQSVGQASVIGTHYNRGYYLRQGYQQPLTKIKAKPKDSDDSLSAKVHPNPFSQFITVRFSETMLNDISVMMFDVNARIIHTQEFLPAQSIELRLRDIASGNYFLKVISGNKYYQTKLIKI